MSLERYQIPRSIDDKEEVLDFFRTLMEYADDSLWESADGCKYIINDERSFLSDFEDMVVNMLELHYEK